MHDPQLGRGEPHPQRVVHELAHALDLRAQLIVEALHGQRARAQHGVAELSHPSQGRVAARPGLLVQLLYGGGALLALDLDVGVLVGLCVPPTGGVLRGHALSV